MIIQIGFKMDKLRQYHPKIKALCIFLRLRKFSTVTFFLKEACLRATHAYSHFVGLILPVECVFFIKEPFLISNKKPKLWRKLKHFFEKILYLSPN